MSSPSAPILNYPVVRNWDFGAIRHRFAARDAILYALGVGYGSDPEDARQTRFVYEQGLAAAPTMPVALGSPGPWWTDPRTGVEYGMNLHGEQDLVLCGPVPAEGEIVARNRVCAVHDRGLGRGALAALEREIVDAASGHVLAIAKRIEVLRGAGGFSAVHGAGDDRPASLPPFEPSTSAPDMAVDLACSPQAHLIYRLSGDPNPLHVDHSAARAAGYARPILHGLATFGMAGHAVLRALCAYEPTRLQRLAARFSAPVFPGDTLRFAFWRTGGGAARFVAHALERKVQALDRGLVEHRE